MPALSEAHTRVVPPQSHCFHAVNEPLLSVGALNMAPPAVQLVNSTVTLIGSALVLWVKFWPVTNTNPLFPPE
jgi:hypothetical protein